MKVAELFRQLAYGQLSNLSIADAANGTLAAAKIPQTVQYANEGLLRLFSRFLLKEKNLILVQTTHVINYHLMREFAVSSGVAGVRHRYIEDCSDEPFTEDVIKILTVQDECGEFLPLNDTGNPCSLYTPTPHTLQVGTPVEGKKLAILYQARHHPLSDTGSGIEAQEIFLPFSLEGALKNFIAAETYSHMSGAENTVKGQQFMVEFEKACLEVTDRDLVSQSFHTSHSKLEERGFV